jgi:hypothetical protein
MDVPMIEYPIFLFIVVSVKKFLLIFLVNLAKTALASVIATQCPGMFEMF